MVMTIRNTCRMFDNLFQFVRNREIKYKIEYLALRIFKEGNLDVLVERNTHINRNTQ